MAASLSVSNISWSFKVDDEENRYNGSKEKYIITFLGARKYCKVARNPEVDPFHVTKSLSGWIRIGGQGIRRMISHLKSRSSGYSLIIGLILASDERSGIEKRPHGSSERILNSDTCTLKRRRHCWASSRDAYTQTQWRHR